MLKKLSQAMKIFRTIYAGLVLLHNHFPHDLLSFVQALEISRAMAKVL